MGINKLIIICALAALALPALASGGAPSPEYGTPRLYLEQGPQSHLSGTAMEQVIAELALPGGAGDIETLAAVRFWLEDAFESSALGGATVGKTDAAGLIKERALGGCHDWALVYAAVLRGLGYPAILADAASLRWARDYKSEGSVYGHVFVEVYAGGKWLLVDPVTGRLILDYDPLDPVIPLYLDREPKGFYAVLKGADPAAYGVRDIGALHGALKEFAAGLAGLEPKLPRYTVLSFARTAPKPHRVSEAAVSGPCVAAPCAGAGKTGLVLQAGGADLHVEKSGGKYLLHSYPRGRVFSGRETETVSFATLRELNARLRALSAP